VWGADHFGGLDPARSDFDGDGRLTSLDLSLLGEVFPSGRSAASAAVY
jgi:hypothetical protein